MLEERLSRLWMWFMPLRGKEGPFMVLAAEMRREMLINYLIGEFINQILFDRAIVIRWLWFFFFCQNVDMNIIGLGIKLCVFFILNIYIFLNQVLFKCYFVVSCTTLG
eukprot:TRINITY_DN265_c0_g1_i3.p3 TRINITY_DN265_c0_g1~~TRINITY_DN265_c0_g1_i3.p3  ORF type:complete len:108 (+),score=2.68 TRINITY_DN265_c0_g1_i3:204-527(+)